MSSVINLFLPLFVQILILYLLSRILDRMVLRRLGQTWYLATMWPGVMVHELAHLVGCIITFTKVHRVHLFNPTQDSLGFVEHDRTRNPVKNIIISIAPLFGVTAVIWLLTKLLWPELYSIQTDNLKAALVDFSSFQNFFSFSRDYFLQYWSYIRELIVSFDAASWQTYVFIYLMLSLSSHAAPSKEDLRHTYYGFSVLVIIFVLMYYIDQWLQIPITWSIVKWLGTPVFFAASLLSYGIIFAIMSVIIMMCISLVFRVFKRGMSY